VSQQAVPTVGRKTDFPAFRDLGRKTALFQIAACDLGGGCAQELRMKEFRCLLVQGKQPLPEPRTRVVLGGHLRFGNLDIRALSEFAHRTQEIRVLEFHHETEDRAACAAAKAFVHLPLRADGERRRALVVKRAQSLERRSRPLQAHVRANHLDDIIRRGDLLDDLLGDARHAPGRIGGETRAANQFRGEREKTRLFALVPAKLRGAQGAASVPAP
jgi:hypothetical protein